MALGSWSGVGFVLLASLQSCNVGRRNFCAVCLQGSRKNARSWCRAFCHLCWANVRCIKWKVGNRKHSFQRVTGNKKMVLCDFDLLDSEINRPRREARKMQQNTQNLPDLADRPPAVSSVPHLRFSAATFLFAPSICSRLPQNLDIY